MVVDILKVKNGEKMNDKIITTLNNIFDRYCAAYMRAKGEKCLENKQVRNIRAGVKGHNLAIVGKVQSDSIPKEYNTFIDINLHEKLINHTKCSCNDYRANAGFNDKYICKHIAATFSKYVNAVEAKNGKNAAKKEDDAGEWLLQYITSEMDKAREIVSLEVYINLIEDKEEPFYDVTFKIGTEKMYVLKSIEDFIKYRNLQKPLEYGKEFTYDPSIHYFSKEDRHIIDFIEEYWELTRVVNNFPVGEEGERLLGASKILKGKSLIVVDSAFKRFLRVLGHKNFYLKLNDEDYKIVKVSEEEIPFKVDLIEDDEKNIILKSHDDIPICLTTAGDVILYEDIIYIPPKSQRVGLKPLLSAFVEDNNITFKRERANEVINRLVPVIKDVCEKVYIDKSIEDRIEKKEATLEIYFDRDQKYVWSKVVVNYGETAFELAQGYSGKKLILRDLKKENEVLNMLENFKFLKHRDRFLFRGREEELYDFLDSDIQSFNKLGEVYYSDRFKEQKVYKAPIIKGEIKEKSNYLEFSFDMEEIDNNEILKILKAFQDNRRYYKLKNNSFLDLQSNDIQTFLKLLDDINIEETFSKDDDENIIKVSKNRAVYLKESLDNESFKYIRGKDILDDISNKLMTLSNVDYEVPKEINATLREYQVIGFKWLKTLSHYGFGGILADEMGLGKTVQTITFLLSEKGKKTLIVTPTSLIYNWEKEFKKFAPSMKILILHGLKEERIELMKSMDNYDVILTTYGILRNDFEEYKKINFNHCIIDEGQNIKNPLSQNSESVKDINAEVKFALTGTPLENNLLELWSIFDFIMPGYLYGNAVFQKKFMGKSREGDMDDLRSLIKPFILRRLKRDVMKELPDKIEKKFYVEMTPEQKKVYMTYVGEIRRLMKEKDFGENKITIFSYLTKLRELCLDPSVLVNGYNGGSGKMDVSLDIIRENIGENRKVLLFSQFTSVLKNIGKMLTKNGIEYYYLDGSTKPEERIELVNKFNNGEDKKVFLISLKAGGTGLNLTSANVVVHFDPWWNPAVEDQATDRAHRFGQKNVVQVIKLIAEGSVEDKIITLQEDKKELINKVITGDFKEGGFLKGLSKEDLEELFS